MNKLPKTRCPVCGNELDDGNGNLDELDPAEEIHCWGPWGGGPHWTGTKEELITDDDDYLWCQ